MLKIGQQVCVIRVNYDLDTNDYRYDDPRVGKIVIVKEIDKLIRWKYYCTDERGMDIYLNDGNYIIPEVLELPIYKALIEME